jgi:hypothetical protein
MIAGKRPLSSPARIREMARNMERALTGATDKVCLSEREGQFACTCYRDTHHDGKHRCVCGAEWASS